MIDPYVASVGAKQTSSAVCSSLRLGVNRCFFYHNQTGITYFPVSNKLVWKLAGGMGSFLLRKLGVLGAE